MPTLIVRDHELAPYQGRHADIIGYVSLNTREDAEHEGAHPETLRAYREGRPWFVIARYACLTERYFASAEAAIYALQVATVSWPDYAAIALHRDYETRHPLAPAAVA